MSPMDAVGMVFTACWMAALLYCWVRWGLVGTVERLLELTRRFVDLVAHGPNLRVRSTPTHLVIEKRPITHDSVHHYYRGEAITKAVEAIWSPIEDVIRAVERECEDEVRVSKSYREQPELIYEGHPWMRFVRTGDAEWLGWSRNHKPGPSPVEQRRASRPSYAEQAVNRRAVPNRIAVGSYASGEDKPVVDLEEYMRKGLLEAGDVVPLILRYDVDGRPIYDKRVPASSGKQHVSEVLRNANGKAVVQRHTPQEVRVTDPDSGEYLGSVGVCPCGDCESEPWDDRLRNGG